MKEARGYLLGCCHLAFPESLADSQAARPSPGCQAKPPRGGETLGSVDNREEGPWFEEDWGTSNKTRQAWPEERTPLGSEDLLSQGEREAGC